MTFRPDLEVCCRGAGAIRTDPSKAKTGSSARAIFARIAPYQGMLGSGMFARNESAKAKSEALIAKLTSVQIPLGAGAVGLGVASFVV